MIGFCRPLYSSIGSFTVGQSTGLTSPRSEGRAFKPNSLMLQAALKSRSWRVPHSGQVQLCSLSFNPLYTQPHLQQVFELGAKRSIFMRFTPYHRHLYSSSVRNIPKDASPIACARWWNKYPLQHTVHDQLYSLSKTASPNSFRQNARYKFCFANHQ